MSQTEGSEETGRQKRHFRSGDEGRSVKRAYRQESTQRLQRDPDKGARRDGTEGEGAGTGKELSQPWFSVVTHRGRDHVDRVRTSQRIRCKPSGKGGQQE